MKIFYFMLLILFAAYAYTQSTALRPEVAKKAANIEEKLVPGGLAFWMACLKARIL